ncbi:MAG: hypothetical protein ACFFAO_19245 [Candidatus Hermodarchaeota archaeon]
MVLSLYNLGMLVEGIIFGILAIKMAFIYREERIVASFVFLLFFIVGSVSSFIIFFWDFLMITSPVITFFELFSGALVVMFFFLAALAMIKRYRWFVFPIVVVIIASFFLFIELLEPQYYLVSRFVFIIAMIFLSLPVIVLYFYLYRITNSGKALGYSLGMLVLAFAGIANNFWLELEGLLRIIGSLIIAAALFGLFDKYLSNSQPTQN